MSANVLYGRAGSHYTRLARIFALEAGVDLEFSAVTDMTVLDPAAYGGHPALKLPLLQLGEEQVFGTENICRRLVAGSPHGVRVAWPDILRSTELSNAQELVWHAMQAQVQLVLGVRVGRLPADNLYFAKSRAGLLGALAWLDGRLDDLLPLLPEHDISLLEASLYCLLEHLAFQPTIESLAFPRLDALCSRFGQRASARATPYAVTAPAR